IPDVDENGFTILDELSRTSLDESSSTYFYTGKLTGAVTPDHQGSIAVMGSPGVMRDYFTVTGQESATFMKDERNILDVAGKWTSKFFDNKTQVDVVAGYHGDTVDQTPGFAGDGSRSLVLYQGARPLTDFARYEQNYGGVPVGCDDMSASDPYPMITNCPVIGYRTGGVGFIEDTNARRLSGLASVTQRVQAAGHHVIKAGADIEEQTYDSARQYSNGARYIQVASGAWVIRRFLGPDGEEIAPGDDLSADTRTRNLGAYVQDSWSILPNLTVNAGLRWERQTLYSASQLVGQISPNTGEEIGEEAFTLNNMLAPRVGVIYDWTQEGRSKVYGHYGRFYESIPMDINVRAYG